jgi:hypothetical protein
VWDHWGDAACSRHIAVRFAGVAFVANDSARFYVRADVEQGFKMTGVGRFSPRQVEADDRARSVGFRMDFRGEAAARTPERLTVLPPLAPAADTWARTMVESNI